MTILLTGATGFIGHALFSRLVFHNFDVHGVARSVSEVHEPCLGKVRFHEVAELDGHTEWSTILEPIDLVVHCAAVAHGKPGDIKKVNVDATINLARQAAVAGCRRFVFISSIGVNGNTNSQPFVESDTPNPTELYTQSKLQAEQGLWDIHRETGMEIVIIRPPLVYGAGAPGNFGALARWVRKKIPLPLGAIHNKRSLVALDNLVDLIITCIDHPAAANQVFLAGDGEDLSTTELLRGVGKAMGKPARLIPVPAGLLMAGATVLGKKAMAQRLLGSLQVDISKARDLLGWRPPVSVEEGLRRCFPSVDSVAKNNL